MDLNTFVKLSKIINEEDFKDYKKNNSISLKTHELDSLESLLEYLIENNSEFDGMLTYSTDNFFVGYTIPQIGEEFDLIRIGTDFNVNIELKSDADIDKMTKQLLRKKYYLSFLEKKTNHFIFSSLSNKMYRLEDTDVLIECSGSDVLELLSNQTTTNLSLNNMNNLFNPSNYLISPFNTTHKFIDKEYFLTQHQIKIKNSIIEKSSLGHTYQFMLEGAAGTGKTLLLYDLAATFRDITKNILVIHVGYLNDGHYILRNTYNWNIVAIKNFKNALSPDLDIIFLDETQRINEVQLEKIQNYAEKNNIMLIYSLDKNQCLHNGEIKSNIQEKISDIVSIENQFKLKEKIRSNKEMADFIKLFNKVPTSNLTKIENKNNNIKLKYFDELRNARMYVELLKNNGWKHITYSTSMYGNDTLRNIKSLNDDSSHIVIGQEFDKVVVLIDNNFRYEISSNGKNYNLVGTGKSYYHSTKMLFQNMTRARKEICLVIANNNELFKKCSEIFVTV